MARKPIIYICNECGANHNKWTGQCSCGAWNTLSKEEGFDISPKGLSDGKGKNINFVTLKGKEEVAVSGENLNGPSGISKSRVQQNTNEGDTPRESHDRNPSKVGWG